MATEWPDVDRLTDRELLQEMALNLRLMADAITAIGQNPMAAAFMGGMGKRA